MHTYADVILPLALPQNYTYRVPEILESQVKPGMRVIVQLGKRKLYTALVYRLHRKAPEGYTPKDILEIEDTYPIVTSRQFELWAWMADYYMCSMGEVMMAALPAGLKLESETTVIPNHLKEIVDEELSDHEYLIVEALQSQHTLSIKEISEITGISNPLKIIRNLLGKHYILLEEELKTGYKPKQKRYVRLWEGLPEDKLSTLFEELERAPKQRELLLSFFKLQGELGKAKKITAARLLKESGAGESSLKSLQDKEVLELFYDTESSLPAGDIPQTSLKTLNEHQAKALAEIQTSFKEQETVLLHGVTSSGKTEIYVQLIEEVLSKGQQVLYLVPEIALTTQLITRLKQYFGNKVLVFHSRFSDRERVETWLQLVQKPREAHLVIGARSSVFLPFGQLGLIIVDEEHETSFKQFDPAPRYHARDTAIVMGLMHQAKTLLGSATPSFETYYNAQQGKFGLVELMQRHGNLPLPEILCIDLKRARSKREMQGHFSTDLMKEIQNVLNAKKQVILFQNRRGFTTTVQCRNCGHITQCKNCDITLTYHKHIDKLRCHYCGYSRQVPQRCPACNSPEISSFGFGTEKLEDDLKLMLENAEVQRMDLDSTRKKNAYENIISDFEDGIINILVGTQMVTKGLDFENVALVGIINADTLLNFPDFRSHERAFQLMAQVAGRSGRKGERGKVLIQTSDPYHNVIRKVMENDYSGMYQDEIYERKNFKYPPFYRFIRITLKHRDKNKLSSSANLMSKELRQLFGERVLGPEFPMIARLRNRYLMEILIKLEDKVSLKKAKIRLRETIEDFFRENADHKVQVIYDVDPY
ncbi:MAG TPA: primosomal protein N' [Cryomorphaceae bacterium]|nr:primosomal protein N' [Owenweeksia sp.]MBF99524.1 primosomal protein N' [Owenweeksia sp.]HAD98668.1 primosomal protein N' [Cryomorphaceae bacterium]HBF22063.1 primosomal protein N' [Cryomorphaceae bacterium]|tara:strand:- start:946 stop:3402 length:2457 start_codon:yes stop_codon:yes gene_type:complete